MKCTKESLRSLGIGGAGQGLNFAAMLLPLLLSEKQGVVNIVIAAAIANCLLYFSILALPMVYPSTESDAAAGRELQVTVIFHTVVSLAFMVIGIGLLAFSINSAVVFYAAGILIFQGFDNILIAWLVRRHEAHGIRRNRLRYGVTNFVLTSAAATISRDPWALCLAAVATYLVAAIWIASMYRAALVAEMRGWHRLSVSEFVGVIRGAVPTGLSYSLNAVTSQSASFSLFSLGPFAVVWAGFNRICGGFSTVSLQLFAPRSVGQ